jgi:hypothetical protein
MLEASRGLFLKNIKLQLEVQLLSYSANVIIKQDGEWARKKMRQKIK